MALDGIPAQAGKDRDDWLFKAVLDGKADFSFVDLTVQEGGHTAVFQVFGDALKIDGVRINVSAELEQKIADVLGCMLLTPRLADLIWSERDCTLAPHPRLITSATDAMIGHSQQIDADLAKLTTQSKLIATVGKHWVVANELLQHAGRAENYGWHYAPGGWTGPSETSCSKDPKTGQYIHMIQGAGWAHDMHHVDYSQICVLVSKTCTVDGQSRDIKDVLSDPVLCVLGSHQGPLKVFRQPGTIEVVGTEVLPPVNITEDDNPYT